MKVPLALSLIQSNIVKQESELNYWINLKSKYQVDNTVIQNEAEGHINLITNLLEQLKYSLSILYVIQ